MLRDNQERKHTRIEKAATSEEIVRRITEMSKTEEQSEKCEKIRKVSKERQPEVRRLNTFLRRNKA